MILPLLTQFSPVQVGALATQIMEFFHCFADEVEYIWQFVKPLSSQHHPLTSPFIQRSDIFRHLPIRMVALLPPHRADVRNPHHNFPPPTPHHHHSSVNLVFMEIAQSPSAGDNTCLMGFITKAVTAQIATTCIELILLVRGKLSHLHMGAKSCI